MHGDLMVRRFHSTPVAQTAEMPSIHRCNSRLDFSYDRRRGRYRLRLGKDDLEISSHLLTELMKKAQRAGA